MDYIWNYLRHGIILEFLSNPSLLFPNGNVMCISTKYGPLKMEMATNCTTLGANVVPMFSALTRTLLTLSCPGTGRAIVKMGHSNLRPGSKKL